VIKIGGVEIDPGGNGVLQARVSEIITEVNHIRKPQEFQYQQLLTTTFTPFKALSVHINQTRFSLRHHVLIAAINFS